MNILELIQLYGVEYLGRYYSTYRAIVMDNRDPDKVGKLKLLIPIHDNIEIWARPNYNDGGPNCGFQYLAPRIGQVVYVQFEAGDLLKPLWSYHGWAIGERPDEFDEETLGIVTPNGNKIYLKEAKGELFIEVKGNINLTTSKDVNVVAKGNSIVKSKKVQILADDIDLIDGSTGIPESTSVTSRLNAVEESLIQLKTAISASTPDSPASLKTSIVSAMGTLPTLTTISDIASKHIKQPK